MLNQVSNEISIQAVSDLDTLNIGYGVKVTFNCQVCNKIVNIFSHNLRRVPVLQCKHCKQVARAAARTPEEKIKTVEKRKQTSLERFGCTSFTKTETYRDKTRATNLQKYGVEWQTQSSAIQDKIKQTNLERYGVERPAQSKQVQEKAKQTLVERYGDSNYRNEDQRKSTCLQKYGVTHPAKTPEFQKKRSESYRQHCLKIYGVDNILKLSEVRQKIKATCKEKFGVENFFQDRNRLKDIWLDTWGVDNPSKVPGNRAKAAKAYVYKDIGFDSSWELAIWIYAEDHNEVIEREPCSFTYVFNGAEHTYFPDFRYNGKLIEIKGSQFFDESGKMVNPFNNSGNDLMEAKHLCGLKNGVEFWRYDKVKPFLNYVNLTYGKDWLRSFRRK